jgi:hypothetical protein
LNTSFVGLLGRHAGDGADRRAAAGHRECRLLFARDELRQPPVARRHVRPTKPNKCGISLENYGVAPDVWVENTPEDELMASTAS